VGVRITNLVPPHSLHTASMQPTNDKGALLSRRGADEDRDAQIDAFNSATAPRAELPFLFLLSTPGMLTQGSRGAARPPWPYDSIGFPPASHYLHGI
jgi:hypothetical protein